MSGDRPAEHPHALDDGAYLLGALSPQQRSAYETHLAGCADCARSVAELSGMPGLLDRVPTGVAEALAEPAEPAEPDGAPEPAPLPATLLPAVLARAEREQRRRRLLLAVPAAVAAVAVVVALVVTAALRPGAPAPGPAPGTQVVALQQVSDGPLSVQAHLTPVAWGTRIELYCSYATVGASAYRVPPSYSVVLRDTDGRVEQVAGWRAVPGREVVVPAATGLRPGQISQLEVRTATGEPVLRAEP